MVTRKLARRISDWGGRIQMIQIKNTSFRYHSSNENSINSIDLHIQKGEFVILCGQSGCGKTTLTRLINGLVPHFYKGKMDGQVLLDGTDTKKMKLNQIAGLVGSVFQDPRSQFFTVDTISEIAFACENMGLPREEIAHRVMTSSFFMGVEELLGKSLFKLSSGEKQQIAITSVHAVHPPVYVLDEPSANLDTLTTFRLKQVLSKLKSKGHTIVISEHRLYYLMELADRIIYLKDGKICEEWPSHELMDMLPSEIRQRGLRTTNLNNLTSSSNNYSFINRLPGSPMLQAVGLSFKRKDKFILQPIDFKAYGGEIIGITGANGVGKTTLVRLLSGLIKENKGNIKINDRIHTSKKRTKRMYFVMQDTDYQLFTESVEDELRLGNEKDPAIDRKINEMLKWLDLYHHHDVHPLALSGGEKQRVTIGTAAVSSSEIIFFDEPTSGLDSANMERVSDILKQLAQNGKLLFVISHDIEFLLSTCSRIINISEGKINHDFRLNDETVDELKEVMYLNTSMKST